MLWHEMNDFPLHARTWRGEENDRSEAETTLFMTMVFEVVDRYRDHRASRCEEWLEKQNAETTCDAAPESPPDASGS